MPYPKATHRFRRLVSNTYNKTLHNGNNNKKKNNNIKNIKITITVDHNCL